MAKISLNEQLGESFKIKNYKDVLELAEKLNLPLVKKLDVEEIKEFDEYCTAWQQGEAWVEDNKIYYTF